MQFHDRLDELMTKRKISNYRVAKDLGFSDSLVGKWRNGKTSPSVDVFIALGKYFDVSLDYLSGQTNKTESGV